MRKPLLAPLLLLLLAAPRVRAQEGADVALFDEVWSLVKRNFHDRRMNGADWDAVRELYRPEAAKARSPRELKAVIHRMLGELKASHCALIEGEVYREHHAPEFAGRATLRAGLELALLEGGYFVAALYEKGPAERAGVRLGDRVLRIDGEECARSGALLDAGNEPAFPGHVRFHLRVRPATPLTLEVERERGGRAIVLAVVPEEMSLVQATRDSIRVVERHGKRFGVIHLWHFMSAEVARALRDAIDAAFAGCDALVLDLRGRGGTPIVMNQAMAAARRWTRPAACLIDEGTRSAKEIFAWRWRKDALGPLVGVKTPGAVIGSTVFKLSDGSYLMLAVLNVDALAGGERLEGRGVEPDVAVDRDPRWAAGRDPILDKGIDCLAAKLGVKVRREF